MKILLKAFYDEPAVCIGTLLGAVNAVQMLALSLPGTAHVVIAVLSGVLGTLAIRYNVQPYYAYAEPESE